MTSPSTLETVLGIIVVSVPLLTLAYLVVFKNAQATLESISVFRKIFTLYFSQYYLVFNKSNIRQSIYYGVQFLFSVYMMVALIYVFIVFFFSYLFGLTIRHSDTFFVLIVCFAIGIRFLIYKEGRQKVELFSWLISIALFAWLLVGALQRLYIIVAPELNNRGFQFVTNWFHTELNITPLVVSSFPANPVIHFLSLCMFIFAEYVSFARIEPAICGPWGLCYEVDSDIRRIIGREKIVKSAKELIQSANIRGLNLVWVTTTLCSEVMEELTSASNIPQITITLIARQPIPVELPANIMIKQSKRQFPRGFLLIPKEDLLITTFAVKGMTLGKPSIGFRTADVAVLTRFQSIYQEL